jgi:nucleotide-binding universal stress UspA family protein
MSTSHIARSHILAAIDYSECSTPVVEQAVAIARRCQPSELHFLHVNHSRNEDADGQEGRRFELLEWLGARLPQEEDALDGVSVIAHEAIGEPWRVIVQTASDLASDLVVMGTHGRVGLQRIMLGSVAEAVSRNCGCSVHVVRQKVHPNLLGALEPPCPLCVQTRLDSQGNVLWCHDHTRLNRRQHAFYQRGLASWVRQSIGAS